jgi:hypothetical protein
MLFEQRTGAVGAPSPAQGDDPNLRTTILDESKTEVNGSFYPLGGKSKRGRMLE